MSAVLFSQSVALGKCFPYAFPDVLLSVTSLCDQGFLPSSVPPIHFSPNHVSPSPTFRSVASSSSAVPQIDFLGAQNDSIFI